MPIMHGKSQGLMILLHGGAGNQDPKGPTALAAATAALRQIADEGLARLKAGDKPIDVVVYCLQAMESDPQFNAGVGSSLQADGIARLTAAIMDGQKQTFSGVIGATNLRHPSLLARHLQGESSRVLGFPGVELLARQLKLPVESVATAERLKRWSEESLKSACDTVGCLVRSADGELVAGTSTGGRGLETPGRISDSATVAGTYCSPFAAISATGVGEQIVDDALAARLETRRRDGLTLAEASLRAYDEANDLRRSYGWIAADREGFWSIAHTTPVMPFVIVSSIDGELAKTLPINLITKT